MSEQADLFGTPENPGSELERAFWAFHHENPGVYRLISRFADEAAARGYEHFSISMVVERVRWETMIVTTDDEFKINNNHRAYYARLWMRDHPDHPDFFRTRELRAGPATAALGRD